MKKYLAIIAIIGTVLSCSTSTLLSSDRTFFEKQMVKPQLENLVKGRFDYNNDIAVASKGCRTEISAKYNASEKMYNEIYNYAYALLSQMMMDANVSGRGFDSRQMRKYSIEIADRYTREAKEIGKFRDDKNGLYYTSLKISKEIIKTQTTRIFREKLNRVIESLNNLKEGIN